MRRVLTALAAGAAVAAVLAAVPGSASAAGNTTVTVQVLGPDDQPAGNVALELRRGDTSIYFDDTTGSDGRATQVTSDDELDSGTWTLYLDDTDEDRFDARTQYALAPQQVTIVGGEQNTLDPVTMAAGARLDVTVTAPSGRPYRNLPVRAVDADGETLGLVGTSSAGLAQIPGIYPTTAQLFAGVDSDSLPFPGVKVREGVEVATPGQVVPVAVTGYRVKCQASFAVSSPKKGQVKLSIKSSAASSGITQPGGKVVIKNGSKTVKTISWTKRSTYVTTVTGQPRGKRVTYKATYTGGDCLGWASSKAVTVRKK